MALPKVPGPPLLSTEGIDEEWVGGKTTTLNQKEPNDTTVVTPGFNILKNELQKTYTGELNQVVKTGTTESAFTGGGQGSALAVGTEGMTLSRFGHKIRFMSSLPRKLFKQLLGPTTVSPLGFGVIESKLTPGDKYKASMEVTSLATQATTGVLVVGQSYTITLYNAGDDFTNVGATSNALNVSFIATGTTPTTWTHASELTYFETLTSTNSEDEKAWGGNTTKIESIVHPSNAAPVAGFATTEASQEQIDSFTALRSTIVVNGGLWPVLVEHHVDPRTGIVVRITKTMVDASAVAAISPTAVPGFAVGSGAGPQVYAPGVVITASTGPNVQIEHQPFNKYRSIQLVSTVTQLPADEDYVDIVQISLPSILLSASVNEAYATAGTGQSANSASLVANIQHGYSGGANATVVRKYSFGPPTVIPGVTVFKEQQDAVAWYWWYFTASFCGAEARTWDLPPTLHDTITIAIAGSPSGTGVVTTLGPTSPIGYASGDVLIHAARPEKIELGLWVLDVVAAIVP